MVAIDQYCISYMNKTYTYNMSASHTVEAVAVPFVVMMSAATLVAMINLVVLIKLRFHTSPLLSVYGNLNVLDALISILGKYVYFSR